MLKKNKYRTWETDPHENKQIAIMLGLVQDCSPTQMKTVREYLLTCWEIRKKAEQNS